MRETKWTLQNALNALDDVFYIYDERGRLVFWNVHLNDLFDLTDEQIDGMQPSDFFLEADRPSTGPSSASSRRVKRSSRRGRTRRRVGFASNSRDGN